MTLITINLYIFVSLSDLGRARAGDCGLAVTAGRLLSDASRGCELQQLIVELLANLAETGEIVAHTHVE